MSTLDSWGRLFAINGLDVDVRVVFTHFRLRAWRGVRAAIGALTILTAGPLPACADEMACQISPTRDCVLDMAVALAERSEDPFRAAQGLLTVAVLREALAMEGADAALSLFIDAVRQGNGGQPDLAIFEFSEHLVARENSGFPSPFSDWQSEAPKAMARLADVVREIGRGMSNEGALIRDITLANLLGLAGKNDELAALVAASDEAAKREDILTFGAMGLLSRRDFAGAEALAVRQANTRHEAAVHDLSIRRYVTLGDFAAALALTEQSADPHDRARELAWLARDMTWQGELDAARAVADRTDLQAEAESDADLARLLAEVHANLGDQAKVAAFTGTLRTPTPERPSSDLEKEARQLEAVAALVAGDEVQFLWRAFESDGEEAQLMVWWSVHAALAAGRKDLDAVVEALPVSLRHTALTLMANHRAKAGELDAALATMDRLEELKVSQPWEEGDPRLAIAPLLVKRGRAGEAVAMALAVGDVALLASLAVDLPE